MNDNFARIVYCRNDLGSLYQYLCQYLYQYIDVAFVAAPDLIFPRIFTDLAMTVPRRSPYCRDRTDRIKQASETF